MKSTALIILAALAAPLILPAGATAATAAYWRHQDGAAGTIIPDGPNTVTDSSGSGNHMQTFSSAFAPFTAATYVPIVSPLPLRSGLSNTMALDFGPMPAVGTEDGGNPSDMGRNDDNFTAGKPINNQLFNELTVELAFRMNTVSGFQALVAKDGKPLGDAAGEDDSPIPPFKIMVRGDDFPDAVPNQLFVEWIDGDGMLFSDIHFLSSGFTIEEDKWYQAAFTLNATSAELWVSQDTGPYQLVDAISGGDFAHTSGHVLVQEPLGWTVGRGMHNLGVTDWSDAIIDEVRISNTVLTPENFLFVTAAANNADFDGDSDVDGNDFLIWQRGVGTNGGQPQGNANGTGGIDGADLTVWRNQFGGAPVQGVPEPATAALAALGLTFFFTRRRE